MGVACKPHFAELWEFDVLFAVGALFLWSDIIWMEADRSLEINFD
jgi:hypothetical protein